MALLEVLRFRRDVRDHHGERVAAERLLEHARELRVTVGHELRPVLARGLVRVRVRVRLGLRVRVRVRVGFRVRVRVRVGVRVRVRVGFRFRVMVRVRMRVRVRARARVRAHVGSLPPATRLRHVVE